jgi:hypothetical protein
MNANRPNHNNVHFISAAFILLWVYTAGSKLTSFENYRLEMQHQVFSPIVSELLIYIIPITELLTAGLLLFQKTNKSGDDPFSPAHDRLHHLHHSHHLGLFPKSAMHLWRGNQRHGLESSPCIQFDLFKRGNPCTI